MVNPIALHVCAAVITDDEKQKSKKISVNVKINKLHSELKRHEFKITVTKPFKETGTSLLGLGQRLRSWLGSFAKS